MDRDYTDKLLQTVSTAPSRMRVPRKPFCTEDTELNICALHARCSAWEEGEVSSGPIARAADVSSRLRVRVCFFSTSLENGLEFRIHLGHILNGGLGTRVSLIPVSRTRIKQNGRGRGAKDSNV